ncbi:efflux RND transporter periplasmic adaptor subunit [Vibrio mangrovi]|uniref:Cation efflux system protein CusB n=1 Tax=Vibrio mangrovi TaxID=474394 RepID=A0A1Y6ISB7_9VIBR|nr:efflux RND transporter periplasmic adaptor subunit [Vibrio mangrovi]MDW6004238.1 efflux RND transporter periplasmic adaptor subunit [Vibrio mangrovi]SMR98963.1 Cation efflux system protein CusB precursor [Vibrio mangrovi]
MKTTQVATLALIIGASLGFGSQYIFSVPKISQHAISQKTMTKETVPSGENKPLYWVAPMDPNYKRDKPGKSPMGMDLIPVYAESSDTDKQPGTVTIDPSVENNLGVKTASAELVQLSPRIETVGYIAFDESRLWQINVRVAGWIEKLYVNTVGEQVSKDDILFTLYSPELVKAQEELLNANRTGRRNLLAGATERLVTLGVDRQQIQSILKNNQVSRSIAVKAPANGVVASLNIREGGYLSPAQAVISAGPLNEVWVDAEVFERQAHWVKAKSLATMTLDAIPGREWQGEVDYVYPILDPKTRTLRVRLKFPNPDGDLKPNMFANIALQPVTEKPVLTIPKSAVIHSGGMTRIVLAEGDGKYRSAQIATGREDGDNIEVLQGLKKNDRVVTSAQFLLDSESSQSADLSRINGVTSQAQTAWASGEITDVMKEHRMLTINHQPVPEWDWPGMVMNFTLADNIEADNLQPGQAIDFELKKTASGGYEIIDFKIGDTVISAEVWLNGDISSLMKDYGMITLKHQPVAEWNWDSGEMNFSVGDKVDLSGFAEGDRVRFLVRRQNSEYILQQLQPVEGAQ